MIKKLWNEDHLFINVLDNNNVQFGKVSISFGMSTTALNLEGSTIIRVAKNPNCEL